MQLHCFVSCRIFTLLFVEFFIAVHYRPVAMVVIDMAIRAVVRVRFPVWSYRTQCRQRLAIIATFLWSYVAEALSRMDGFRHLLHSSG